MQVQLHAESAAKRPRSLLSIWEAGTGVLAAQGACEHDSRSLSWFCGPGLPECLCLTQVWEGSEFWEPGMRVA